MAPLSKKRKIEAKKGNVPSQAAKGRSDNAVAPSTACYVPASQVKVDMKIQQAKKYAVAQAQQEGCLGNFKSFDSPFGNYLLPVVPTLADLST